MEIDAGETATVERHHARLYNAHWKLYTSSWDLKVASIS